MRTIIRLHRLQDQYLQISSVLAAGIMLGGMDRSLWLWMAATTCISFSAFLVNEWVDRSDTDRWSWNRAHLSSGARISRRVGWTLGLGWAIGGLGFGLAAELGAWAMAMIFVGIGYSAYPLRLKARPVVDIAGQLLVWWIVPFSAPLVKAGILTGTNSLFLVTLIFLTWSVFYPYQLADFRADQAAGIRPTHVVLGLGRSLGLGFFLGLAGLALWLAGGYWRSQPWSAVLALFGAYAVSGYRTWRSQKSEEKVFTSLQQYVRRVKPLTQLLVPYLLLWNYLL